MGSPPNTTCPSSEGLRALSEIPVSEKNNSSEERTRWKIGFRGANIRGWRAASATALQGSSSPKIMILFGHRRRYPALELARSVSSFCTNHMIMHVAGRCTYRRLDLAQERLEAGEEVPARRLHLRSGDRRSASRDRSSQASFAQPVDHRHCNRNNARGKAVQ